MNKLTMEQAQARIKELEAQIASQHKNKPGIELRVTMDEGDVQIRRLTPQALNLPSYILRWLYDNVKEVMEFMKTNSHLISEVGDDETITNGKRLAREQNLNSANAVVRRPRAKNKAVTVDSDD